MNHLHEEGGPEGGAHCIQRGEDGVEADHVLVDGDRYANDGKRHKRRLSMR